MQLAAHRHEPAAPKAADPVTVHATFAGSAVIASVQLRYRVNGGFEEQVPMTAGGGGWRAGIPAQREGSVVTYVFRVGLAGDVAEFFPTATLTKPFRYTVAGVTLPWLQDSPLVINELMADNETALADEAGEYDDWVELYNRGQAPVQLSGYFLSDKADDPWLYALPERALARASGC